MFLQESLKKFGDLLSLLHQPDLTYDHLNCHGREIVPTTTRRAPERFRAKCEECRENRCSWVAEGLSSEGADDPATHLAHVPDQRTPRTVAFRQTVQVEELQTCFASPYFVTDTGILAVVFPCRALVTHRSLLFVCERSTLVTNVWK